MNEMWPNGKIFPKQGKTKIIRVIFLRKTGGNKKTGAKLKIYAPFLFTTVNLFFDFNGYF